MVLNDLRRENVTDTGTRPDRSELPDLSQDFLADLTEFMHRVPPKEINPKSDPFSPKKYVLLDYAATITVPDMFPKKRSFTPSKTVIYTRLSLNVSGFLSMHRK